MPRDALARLGRLDIDVKVITGDNDRVAAEGLRDLGLAVDGTLTGAQIDAARRRRSSRRAAAHDDLRARRRRSRSRGSSAPARRSASTVGFLGDGVNDAVALHDADVGISVETATDVAKDAADIVLLDKDLDILADGVVEGRRIFANTIKYVLMGTSSNFGNMFSAGGRVALPVASCRCSRPRSCSTTCSTTSVR